MVYSRVKCGLRLGGPARGYLVADQRLVRFLSALVLDIDGMGARGTSAVGADGEADGGEEYTVRAGRGGDGG